MTELLIPLAIGLAKRRILWGQKTWAWEWGREMVAERAAPSCRKDPRVARHSERAKLAIHSDARDSPVLDVTSPNVTYYSTEYSTTAGQHSGYVAYLLTLTDA